MKGSALAYALIITALVAVLLTSILTFIASQIKNSLRERSKQQAFQIAESGINFYQWYLAHQTDGRTAAQIEAFWTAGTAYGVGADYTRTYSDPSGTTVGHYRLTVTPPSAGSTIATVQSVGWTDQYPTVTRTIRVRFRRPSWSESTVVSNADIWYGDTETVIGKVFSNGGIRMDGYATNTVSSAVSTYQNASAGAPAVSPGVWSSQPSEISSVYHVPVFQGGKQFPAVAKDFNSISADMNLMKTDAIAGTNGSRYFGTNGLGRHIKLLTNGTYQIRTVSAYSTKSGQDPGGSTSNVPDLITAYSDNWTTYAMPTNGVIFVENDVWLEGQINNNRVTVVAANLLGGAQPNIYIGTANILYTNYDGRDNLGIVAQKSIEVIYDSVSVFRVDGVLLAQTGRVERRYYGGNGDHKTSIRTYGALATNGQYTWNWWVNGTTLYGYTTTQSEYDNKLYYTPPPYFPTGTQYAMDLWEEL